MPEKLVWVYFLLRIKQIKGGCRLPERASHIDEISGLCSRSQNGFALWHRTEDNNICEYPTWRLGRIPAGQHDAELMRKF